MEYMLFNKGGPWKPLNIQTSHVAVMLTAHNYGKKAEQKMFVSVSHSYKQKNSKFRGR